MPLLIYLVFVAAVFYWQMRSVATGKRSKWKAIVSNLACSAAPAVIYGASFLTLVGIEELTHKAIVGEGYARSLPFVLIGGSSVSLLSTLLFSIVAMFTKRPGSRTT